MRIGVDFDNTIADYDGVFHAAALERGLIAADLPRHKNAVRDFLNDSGRKDAFTLLQGYVYGARMDLARPYRGFAEFVATAHARGHTVYVVSHKTRHPILGPEYDMHEAARAFLRFHGLVGGDAIPEACVFFAETKQDKIARAGALDLDVLIDDLPEILLMPELRSGCRRVLFAPDGTAASHPGIEICRSWPDITGRLLGQ